MSTCRSHNFLLIAQNHKLSNVLERYSKFLHLMPEGLRIALLPLGPHQSPEIPQRPPKMQYTKT